MPHVRKTVLAEQDLDDIWFSIALDNPDVADAILEGHHWSGVRSGVTMFWTH